MRLPSATQGPKSTPTLTDHRDSRRRAPLGLLLAMVLFVVLALLSIDNQLKVQQDSGVYIALGQSLSSGRGYADIFVAGHPPNISCPPAFPALDGSKIAKGPKAAHIEIVLNGKPGTAMAAYAAQLNDTEIAAVVAYERNAWSNKLGELVQPADVKALRGK